MLQKALQAKPALKSYISRFLGVDYKLSYNEWDTLQDVCDFLHPFYNITALFSGSQYPTTNLYFENVLVIEYSISEAHKKPKLALMASMMLEKIENYWEDYSLILSIAAVLDPHYKIQRVKQMFNLLCVGEACDKKLNKVHDALAKLCSFYYVQATLLAQWKRPVDPIMNLMMVKLTMVGLLNYQLYNK